MDANTYRFLETRWTETLPEVPWPFDLSADPQAVVTAMGAHLEAKTGRPPLRVTHGEPLVVGPRPCDPPRPGPTKAA